MLISQFETDVERWRRVEDTNNLYVSDMGRVKRIYANKKERMLSPFMRKGVLPYYIKVNGKDVKLAQSVWYAFHDDYDKERYSLIHKCLRTDDRLINLRLVTKAEAGHLFAGRSRRRGIYKVDMANKIVLEYYYSSREAAAKEFCSYQTILDSCNKKTKKNVTGFDFVWSDVVDNSMEWKCRDDLA